MSSLLFYLSRDSEVETVNKVCQKCRRNEKRVARAFICDTKKQPDKRLP